MVVQIQQHGMVLLMYLQLQQHSMVLLMYLLIQYLACTIET